MTLDLVAGRVQVAFGTAVAFLPQVQGGKLNALAVTDARPSPVAPQLPTVAASGLPGFEVLQWFGLLAPAGTPREIVARLNADAGKALQQPDVQQRYAQDKPFKDRLDARAKQYQFQMQQQQNAVIGRLGAPMPGLNAANANS